MRISPPAGIASKLFFTRLRITCLISFLFTEPRIEDVDPKIWNKVMKPGTRSLLRYALVTLVGGLIWRGAHSHSLMQAAPPSPRDSGEPIARSL